MTNWTTAPTLIGALGIMFLSAGVSSPATEQETWRQHWMSGRKAYEEGRYAEAGETLNRAVEAARSQKAERADIARILTYRGLAEWANGNWAVAVTDAAESVRLWRRSKTPAHPDFAAALSNLGFLYAVAGNKKGACDPLREAVKTAEQAAAEGQAPLVQSLTDLPPAGFE
jgi:tetratricopeptide (TPR) repeat protein